MKAKKLAKSLTGIKLVYNIFVRVLVVTAEINPDKLGGAEGHFVEVSKRLAPKVDFVVPKISYPRIPNLTGLVYILFAAPVIIYYAIKTRPNLIWATLDFPQAQVGALAKIFTGIPLYITSQNPLLGEEELVGIGGKVVKYLVSFAFHFANIVAAVSNYSGRGAKKYGAKKVIIIPNGVDLTKFKNPLPRLISQKLNIITTSSLIPRNGIDTLIRACALLKIPWQLTIAGDGPEKQSLKNLAVGLSVKLLGRVPSIKIPQLLRTHNLFVRPSRFEGFGSSFIEAMACGLPVIGTPVGGITDFLSDKQTGFLVSPDDPGALARKINYIYSHQKEAEKIARHGQEFVSKNYSWDTIAAKVYKVWTTL